MYLKGGGVVDVLGVEYARLTNQRVYMQTNLNALTQEQKQIALNPINLFKVKRDGCMRGQFCVDGQPQIEGESQTIVNTFLMLLTSIAAKEKCHIVTVGVAGTYLSAEMDDFLLMQFKE